MEKKDRDFIDHLKNIHYGFKDALDEKNYDKVIEMMELYDEKNDVNELKTILVITQSFKEHEKLGEPRKRLLEIFDRKMEEFKKN